MCVKLNGSPCGKPTANGAEFCSLHARVMERREEKKRIRDAQVARARELRRRIGVGVGWNHWTHPDTIFARLNQEVAENRITQVQAAGLHRKFMRHSRIMIRVLNQLRGGLVFNAPAPPPPPKTELEAFAQDNQNIHRKVVADNTNDQTEKLLAVTVPSDQDTLKEIKTLFGEDSSVMDDVVAWYGVTMCRAKDDCLYKRTLDGLWTLIKASPHKDDLSKRLVEELSDAVGLCCEGHLSRLCNVLVGFDDAFRSVVSPKEILQQRMAEIAAMEDTPTLAKQLFAQKVLEELAIPVAEHAAWLDAF